MDTAKQILQEMGYKVEPASVPLQEISKIIEQKIIESLSPEELKSLLESGATRLLEGP